MLDLLRPLIEAEAAQKGRRSLEILRAVQTRNKLLWGLFSAATLGAFFVIAASVVAAERYSKLWLWGGVAIALLLIAYSEHFRNDLEFLNRQANNARRFAIGLRLRNRVDFLSLQAWSTYGFVVAPALLTCFWLAMRSTTICKPGSLAYGAYADILKQLSALAGALLAGQIALFNFMFSQLLGKYSSAIAVAISQHRVVFTLRSYSVLLMVLLYACYFLGFPDALPHLTVLLALSLAASVVITVWVGNAGICIDRAILYAGEHSARRVKRSLKLPILNRARFWNILAAVGLDWRDPQRMIVTAPPETPAATAISLVTGLFNAAHRSIQENQHETLLSSLQALTQIVDAYVDRRTQYFGSGDQFLSYLNDQLAGVIKAAVKSPNEYMVMNTVTFIGVIGSRALDVGRGPVPKKPEYPDSHPYFSHWQGLLTESFELTHGLMRSTAATQAISQLTNLAKKAVDLGYIENVSLSFPSEMRRVYATCLVNRDAYHISLSGQCVTAMMNVWRYCVVKREVGVSAITKQLCKTVKEMLLAFQIVERLPSVNMEDPVTSVICKTSDHRFTLQDIALILVSSPVTEDWQRRDAVNSLRQLLSTLGELAKDSAARDVTFANDYAECFMNSLS
jgi:hypothetical protein